MSSEAQNLEAIDKALKQHNAKCKFKVTAIVLNPFEAERLDWDDYLGIPIISDPQVGTGRVRILCEGMGSPNNTESEEVVEDIEVVTPNRELVPA